MTGIRPLISCILSSLCICGNALASNGGDTANNPPLKGVIDPEIAAVAYSGDEVFKYDVSWTGGIKIGELHLTVAKADGECDSCYRIQSVITTSGGIVHRLYPVEDRHITYVQGAERLPYFSEIWQKQGRSYTAHKEIIYDQENHRLIKKKDGDEDRVFNLDGVVHNEFSSFFSSRVMDLKVGGKFMVPTFGDDARNEVVVDTLEETVIEETILGSVKTLKVTPILTFSGLYDKRGDTIIWYTSDECRVPVLIQSKIIIGSLTASLAEYANPYCDRYSNAATP